jgi:hypothetical protein
MKTGRNSLTNFTRRNLKNVSVCLILALFIFITITDAGIVADGSTAIQLVITVNFDGSVDPALDPVEITAMKIEEDIEVFWYADTVDGVARISVPYGGSCVISGEEVPGFESEGEVNIPLSRIKGKPVKEITYKYTEKKVTAEELVLSESSLTMINGFDHHLEATVIPGNAVEQEVSWVASGNVEIISEGYFKAVGEGSGMVTATLLDTEPAISTDCAIAVVGIESVNLTTTTMAAIVAVPIELENPVEVTCTDGSTEYVDVTWVGDTVVVDGRSYIAFDSTGPKAVSGEIRGYEGVVVEFVEQAVSVGEGLGGAVTEATIDPNTGFLYYNEVENPDSPVVSML